MANLLRARSWAETRPATGSYIDWGHPLAHGLRFACVFNNAGRPYDAALGISATSYSLTGWDRPSPLGPARANALPSAFFNGTTSTVNFGQHPGANPVGTAPPFTIAAGSFTTAGSSGTVFGRDHNTNGRAFFLHYTSGALALQVGGANAGIGATAVPANTFCHGAATNGPSGKASAVYLNGSLDATGTSQNISSNTANLYLGQREYSGFEEFLSGGIAYAYIWPTRVLSVDEIRWIATEPYAMFAPPGPKVLYTGFNTVTAAASTYDERNYPRGIARGITRGVA